MTITSIPALPLEVKRTDRDYYYDRTGRYYSQEELATLCSELVREYVDGGFDYKAIEIEESDFYERVAARCKVEKQFARSVAHWCGLFIDFYHDCVVEAGAVAVLRDYTYTQFMGLAYDLIVSQDE